MEERKKQHIELAFQSQMKEHLSDDRFSYEPLFSAHPTSFDRSFSFLGKKVSAPLWISSMTGGTDLALKINHNLARACNEFGLSMGLGSCRILMENRDFLPQFNLRPIIGNDLPFFANLGIVQIEQLLKAKRLDRIESMIELLKADGLIVHVNPIQEWLQPDGDFLTQPAIETIAGLCDKSNFKIIVKEVGQGIGPKSLKALLELPIDAIEFAAFGGTNFAMVELLRSDELKQKWYEPFTRIGHNAKEMLDYINEFSSDISSTNIKELIISGGIKSFLDGYYLINKSKLPAIYGQASAFLKFARGEYEDLRTYTSYQIKGLQFAYHFLNIK